MRHKIVIACDSFKGCLRSEEVASAVAEGIGIVVPDAEVVKMPIADGGEGTGRILTEIMGGETIYVEVSDPLGRKITAEYGIILSDSNPEQNKTAVIEMAQASGLTLLAKDEKNPLMTSTYGTGEMILDAIDKGCRKILVGIGGSATNDGGTGMLEALGYRFLDSEGNPIHGCCGGRLGEISKIDESLVESKIRGTEFIVACDVNTPFCGENGASKVFAPQKGADKDIVDLLETGMQSLDKIIFKQYGIDMSAIPGSGAAGGLGGAFKAVLNAELKSGIDLILDAAGFDTMIEDASLVVTGEGHIDSQSSQGKVIDGILKRCKRQNIPVMAIGGIVDDENCVDTKDGSHLSKAFAICPEPQNESDLEYAMRPEVAYQNISCSVSKALRELSPFLFL